MYDDFISRLDCSNPTAKTTLRACWDAWQAENPEIKHGRRRDLEAALREKFAVGIFNYKVQVGGAQLPGTRRQHWTVVDGRLKLALDRERGLAEAIG